MGRSQAELALVAILEADQFLAVEIPSAGFSPQLCGRGNGHEQFLGSSPVHLFTNDLFDLSNDPETEGEICVDRSEEHTSELQSQSNIVCRLLLEKKKKKKK